MKRVCRNKVQVFYFKISLLHLNSFLKRCIIFDLVKDAILKYANWGLKQIVSYVKYLPYAWHWHHL